MALTETESISLGFSAPDFELPDTISGRVMKRADVSGEHGLVVMFICNHCPYVVHVQDELVRLAADFEKRGIGFVAISSNDVEHYPQDGPTLMKAFGINLGFSFPYLYDEDQSVAKAYRATCTPDFSVFDANMLCVYRGRLDDSSPGNGNPVTGADLRRCLDQLISEGRVSMAQFPSMGCNIKWK
ncbi:MAG: thioredoxin family protein [Flavobacteriales bacterium]|nr:thioredoxin family protein [Flavobacteriales bacterium]